VISSLVMYSNATLFTAHHLSQASSSSSNLGFIQGIQKAFSQVHYDALVR
jgi:hypothetical protein